MMFTRVQNARISVVAAAVVLLAAVLAVFLGGTASAHHGDSRETAGDAIVLLAVDSSAVSDPNQAALLESVATAFTSGNNIANKGILFYGGSSGDVITGSNLDLRAALLSWLSGAPTQPSAFPGRGGSDLTEALFKVHEHLDDNDAVSGSRVLVLTSGMVEEGSESDLLERSRVWLQRGWIVDSIILGTQNDSDIGYLTAGTHGVSLALGNPDEFGQLLGHLQSLEAPSAEVTSSFALKRGAETTATFEVPPLTSALELVVYREHRAPFTSVRVVQPNGRELPLGSLSESPHVLVYRSVGEAPLEGHWAVHASSDVVGTLGIQSTVQNPVTATLLNSGLPLNREFLLEAVTEVNNSPVKLNGVELLATVRYGDGPVTTYMLEDDGLGGDKVADDNIYSAVVPPLKGSDITALVDLTFRWDSQDVELTSSTSVSVLEFPEVVTRNYSGMRVSTAGEWLLGNLDVVLSGEPYLVDVDKVSVRFEGLFNEFPATRVVPLDGNGSVASSFAVWGRPQVTDTYELVTRVAVDYQGYQSFTAVFESEPHKLTAGGPPSLHSRPSWLWGAPFWLPLLLPLVLLAIGLAVFKIVRLPRPFGYLTDDRDRVVVKFADYRGGFVRKVFTRNKVRGQDIPGLGLGNVTFLFERNSIKLRYDEVGEGSNVRINSVPCTPSSEIDLSHHDHIGFGGALLKVCYRLPEVATRLGREMELQGG